MECETKNDDEEILQLSCPTGEIEREHSGSLGLCCRILQLGSVRVTKGSLVVISLKKSTSTTAKGYVAMLTSTEVSTEAFCKGNVWRESSSTSCVFTDPDHSAGGYSSWGANIRVSTPLTTAEISH